MKKRASTIIVLMIVIAFAFVGCGKGGNYKKALSLYESGQYNDAAVIFTELGDYENSAEMVKTCKYEAAKALFEAESYEEARKAFFDLGDYENSKEYVDNCEHQIMLQKYADVFKALEGNTWYFNGGADNILNSVSFSGEKATISQIYFDGNWKHDNGSNEHSFVLDDKNIIIKMEDESELKIGYQFSDNKVTLDKTEYLTIEQIEKGIQGYWKVSYSSSTLGMTSKHVQCIYINNGKLVSESASSALGSTTGEYYYYGPYEGAYKLNLGGFDTDMRHGNEWFYNIIDGKLFVFHGSNKAEKTDKLPGENGYSF